jgi:hypothetical protein
MARQALAQHTAVTTQFPIGTKRQRVIPDMWLLDKKTTAVAGSGTYTSSTRSCKEFVKLVGICMFNENGSLTIEQSWDGINFDYVSTFATTGGTGTAFSVEVVAPFFRVKWANGTANATTTHRLFTAGRSMS